VISKSLNKVKKKCRQLSDMTERMKIENGTAKRHKRANSNCFTSSVVCLSWVTHTMAHTHRHTFCSFNQRFPSAKFHFLIAKVINSNWIIHPSVNYVSGLNRHHLSILYCIIIFKATILNFWTEDGIILPWNAHNVTSTRDTNVHRVIKGHRPTAVTWSIVQVQEHLHSGFLQEIHILIISQPEVHL
jgi:hypothetical protein